MREGRRQGRSRKGTSWILGKRDETPGPPERKGRTELFFGQPFSSSLFAGSLMRRKEKKPVKRDADKRQGEDEEDRGRTQRGDDEEPIGTLCIHYICSPAC